MDFSSSTSTVNSTQTVRNNTCMQGMNQGESISSTSTCIGGTTTQVNMSGLRSMIPQRLDFSQPSSPRSTALPSPPDSPSSDSISSFPSVSSSFFFSSSAASPHLHAHSHLQSDHSGSGPSAERFIIPILNLPNALRQPTPHGQMLGDVNLLIIGSKDSGKTALANFLVDNNEDVVEVDPWEETVDGPLLHASTDWREHSQDYDPHEYGRFEGSKNVKILSLRGMEIVDSPEIIIQAVLRRLSEPFEELRRAFASTKSSSLFHSLLSSSRSPLYTAVIFITSSNPTPHEYAVMAAISPYTPVITLPPGSSSSLKSRNLKLLSSFRPQSAAALRQGLLRSPQTLATLRSEAADRFMRWRELEYAADDYSQTLGRRTTELDKLNDSLWSDKESRGWNKAEWEASLSEDLARRMPTTSAQQQSQSQTSAQRPSNEKSTKKLLEAYFAPQLDPLHMTSLLMLSASAIRALFWRGSVMTGASRQSGTVWLGWRIGLAIVSVFCAGVTFGIALSN